MDRNYEFTCPICQDFFDNVVETSCCSTGYCLKCLDGALNSSNGTCPSCRTKISIFQCTPNKMVQRMVDNLPVECLYCPANLTRSIAQEHMQKCEKRPIDANTKTQCPIHKKYLSDYCLQDKQPICSLCALVGSHRHHNSTEKSSVAEKSNFAPATKKEMEAEMITYASVICQDCELPVTVDNVTKLLKASGCTVEDPSMIQLFVDHADKFKQWAEAGFRGDPSSVINSPDIIESGENFSEAAASAEYEILKDKYHKEQFNFEGLQIKVLPLCPFLLPNVKNQIYILLEIRVGKKKETNKDARPPYSVSLVLDRSGSMAGSKLETAKASIKAVIENLSEKDLLHLVEFQSTASVVFRDGRSSQKETLSSAVDRLSATGGTNLSDGLEVGFDLLKTQKDQDMIRKIFLFSDGCAGPGITTESGLRELSAKYYSHGVGTSSFGIGADFDEKIMKGISDSGHGHYFFIDSTQKIPTILEKAFKGLSRTVASNVVLKVKGTKGRQIRKLNDNGDVFKGIPLLDMREMDIKQIMLQVEVEDGESVNPIDILEFELTYDRMDDCIPESPQTGKLSLIPSFNLKDFSNMNDEVLVFLKIHECGELDKTVLKLMGNNQLEEAISIKKEVIRSLSDIVSKDHIGFAKVLLLRAKNRLFDLEKLKSRTSSKSYESVKKEAHRDAKEEEDEDMGFGLFD